MQKPTAEETKFVANLMGAAWFWFAALYGRCIDGDTDIPGCSSGADAVAANIEKRLNK